MLSVVAASIVTRESAKKAFLKKQLGLTTPDIIKQIPKVLAQYWD
jgi:NAD(P)H-hydrate repair Nnr-like enzyme with NAD(P)H-hydrate dehydratase domain